MDREQIEIMLDEVGIPWKYMKFEEKTIQPPFMIWYYDESRGYYADGINYAGIDSVVVELYSDRYDRDLEEKLERGLRSHGIGFRAQRIYIDEEVMYETIYLMEVMKHEN